MKILRVVSLVLSLFVLSAGADVVGTAAGYSVLGASTVTNTGSSVVGQDLGVSPGLAITGFPPGTVLGTIHDSDASALQAQADALNGYIFLEGLSVTHDLTGQDLGGLTLTAGVYSFSASAQLTGQLTLDFQGLNDTTIVFQIVSTLTTASNSSVVVINPGLNDQVYWVVGSSATLGTGTSFYGSIIALTSVTMNTGATIGCGRAIALNGAVTMDTNTIDTGGCASGSTTSTTTGSTTPPSTTVPEPASLSLLGIGLLAAGGARRAKTIASLGLTRVISAVRRGM